MTTVASTPGWYGKLPSLGDFASRRLEGDFIEPWDTWLGEGLAAQRETLGDTWLEAYLASPTWRFVLMPGTLERLDPQRALAGVLMPSVDRVGRYFPLTLVADLDPVPPSAAAIEALLGWLHRLEDVALDALQDDWTIDELEEALERVGPTPGFDEASASPALAALVEALDGDGGFVPIDELGGRAELAALFVAALRARSAAARTDALAARTFWLADTPERPQLLVCAGLPRGDTFGRMFGGAGDSEASGAGAAGPQEDAAA
jgi:type VI secretion system protein ImpM